MINRVIFFVEYPMNKRDWKRLGIQTLLNNKFRVEIWDFTPCLHPGFADKIRVNERVDDFNDTYIIRNIGYSVWLAQALNAATLVIYQFGLNDTTLPVFRAVARSKAKTGIIQVNQIIIHFAPEGSITNKIQGLSVTEIYHRLLTKIILKIPWIFGVQPMDYLIGSTDKSLEVAQYNYPINHKTKQIWVHGIDYDIYLKTREIKERIVQEKYAVFIDEYAPFHSDLLYLGINPELTPGIYYPALCRFFGLLEKKYNISIVIAAHPRSQYETMPDYFNGRKVIRDETAALIRDSEFVIAHMSTSINLAVLFEKPIVFITTGELAAQQDGIFPLGLYIEQTAAFFGKVPILCDDISTVGDLDLGVDKEIYNKYRNTHIKKDGGGDIPAWDLIVSELKSHDPDNLTRG